MTERQEKMRKDEQMTDKQAKRSDILARLDELDRMEEITTDSDTLKWIAERKEVLRTALDSID